MINKNIFLILRNVYIILAASCVMSHNLCSSTSSGYVSAPKLALCGSYAMTTGVVMSIVGALIEHYLYPNKNATKAIISTALQQKLEQECGSCNGIRGFIHSIFAGPLARWHNKHKLTFHKPGLYLLAGGVALATSSVIVNTLQALMRSANGLG